jgi:hypothetical protein
MNLDSESIILLYSTESSLSLLGNLKVTAVNGIYDLEGSGFKGPPGTNATAYISSLSID